MFGLFTPKPETMRKRQLVEAEHTLIQYQRSKEHTDAMVAMLQARVATLKAELEAPAKWVPPRPPSDVPTTSGWLSEGFN